VTYWRRGKRWWWREYLTQNTSCEQSTQFHCGINRLNHRGYFMCHQVNIQQFYVLITQFVFVYFMLISEQTTIVSLYSISWLVFITETVFTARYWLDICVSTKISCVFKSLILNIDTVQSNTKGECKNKLSFLCFKQYIQCITCGELAKLRKAAISFFMSVCLYGITRLFDICVNVHLWYNNINNQLDATITIYVLVISISSTCFGR